MHPSSGQSRSKLTLQDSGGLSSASWNELVLVKYAARHRVMYNEVVRGTVGTALLVAVAVGPSGYAGQIVVRSVVQQPLSELDCLARNEVLRDVANGCMT
jgi:hypothetical protein